MSKVIHLVPPAGMAPQESCINLLERVLEMAKQGEIVSVFVAAQTHDGGVTGWAHPDTARDDNRHAMLGTIELGKHDYLNKAFEHA